MADNIHEKNFVALAKKLDIPVKHGWKSALQKRLKQKNLSIITNWIARGIPDDFHHILENAGIDPAIWREIVADNKLAPSAVVPRVEPQAAKPVSDNPGMDETTRAVMLTTKIISSRHPDIAHALMKNLEQLSAAVDKADELSSCKVLLQQQQDEISGMKIKMDKMQNEINYMIKEREGSEPGVS